MIVVSFLFFPINFVVGYINLISFSRYFSVFKVIHCYIVLVTHKFLIKFEILKCFNTYIYYHLLMEFDFKSENMAIVWTKAVSVFCLVLSLLKLSSALLEPNPFPETLKECYDFRSFNMTPSDEVALMIQNHCFKNYQYKQIAEGKVWTAPNITQEGMNYINSLFRKLFGEIVASSKSKHQKRQAAVRFRREVRSPGAFAPFANCIQDLYGRVNTHVAKYI